MPKLILTSGFNFEGYKIKEYIGFYSGECVLGTGFFSSASASVADFFGSNSSLYEDKLSQAKARAISELEQTVADAGGNAIIGLNVSYTTFTSDIMGVVANGTAVIVEQNSEHENKYLKENPTGEYPVMNYYKDLPIRPVSILFDKVSKELELSIFQYNETVLKALNIDITANTIFGTKYEYSDINFVDCYLDKDLIKTEKVCLDIPYNQIKVIESFIVQVNYCILSGELISLNEPYFYTNVSAEQLCELRNNYGKDVVGDFQENSDTWLCLCGVENKEDVCKACGRKKKIYSKAKNKDIISLREYLPQMQQLRNSKEIYDFVTDLEKMQEYHFSKDMMKELREKNSFERLYGNMKEESINIIRKYIMDNC